MKRPKVDLLSHLKSFFSPLFFSLTTFSLIQVLNVNTPLIKGLDHFYEAKGHWKNPKINGITVKE